MVGNLRQLLERAGRADSGFMLTAGEQCCTGQEFAQQVRLAAAGLLAAGLRPLDRVAVLLPKGIAEAVAICAVACAGGIAVPMHGKLRDDQVRHILTDAAPFAVITDALRLLALRDSEALLSEQRCWRVGESPLPVPARGFAELQGELANLPESPAGPAVMLYTSGSTGLPKGIVQTHANLAHGAQLVSDYLGLQASDRILAVLPMSFDYGLNQLLGAMHSGCRVHAGEVLGVGEWRELLQSVRPTVLAGVPSLWHQLAQGLGQGALTAADGASLRLITNSGGTLQRADSSVLRNHWSHVQVFAMYGLTEAFRSAFLPPEQFDAHPDAFGFALPGVELLLVDQHRQVLLTAEAQGELVHVGALVAQGYWRNPEATARKFGVDPRGGRARAVFSGDLVRRDAAGRHYFVGRMDRLLKVQGHRVSPDELVAAVRDVPGVGEVAALGLPGGAEGHRIVLVLAGDPQDAALPALVLRRCRQRLPSYCQPSEVIVRAQLPHNPNGKIDEPALQESLR